MRQLRLSLLLGLLLPLASQAQSVRFQSQAISTRGAGIANATVAVCTQPAVTTTQPCSPLATLATSTSTTSGGANPLTADSFGNFFFYAAPGRYTVQIYGPAVFGQLVTPDTVIPSDPTGGSAGNPPIYVGNATYPCTATGVNAALTAARGTGIAGTGAGIVDATACTGNVVMNAQINVGDSTFDPVFLKLPSSGTWDFNMTDGTSCGIKQFSQTQLTSQSGANPPFALLALTGANMKAVYCTDPSPSSGSSYIRAEGFSVKEQTGVALSTAVMDVRQIFDSSRFRDISVRVATNPHIALLVTGTCCASEFNNIDIDAGNLGVPLKLNGNVNSTSFFGVSPSHPGSGLNAISVSGSAFDTVFVNTYIEDNTNGVDTTTPLVEGSGTAGGSIAFYGGLANILSGSTNKYVFKRDTGANPVVFQIHGYGMLGGSGNDQNCVNDAQTGLNYIMSNTSTGTCPNYGAGTTWAGMVLGRGGAPGAALTIDYSSTTEQPVLWRNNAVGGKNWLTGDGVTAGGTFSFFDNTDSKNVLNIVGGASPSVQPVVPLISVGTQPTLTGTGACATITTQAGGAFAGTAKCTGATAASTFTITFTVAAPNGYVCDVWDETTRANLVQQTSHSTTACGLTATSITQNDVLVFKGVGF